MILTATETVQHARFSVTATDDMGMPAPAWAAPVSVSVFGWWPSSSDDTADAPGRRRVTRDLDLIVPAGTVCGDRDRWTVAGQVYSQTGGADDFNHGPFGTAVPLVVYLRRVEG